VEIRGRQPAKTVAVISLAALAAVTFHRIDDFKVTIPLKPVFDAPAYSGGTAISRGPYHATPPNGRIDVTAVRRFIGGAAIPDS
jgi:hypothetical protein